MRKEGIIPPVNSLAGPASVSLADKYPRLQGERLNAVLRLSQTDIMNGRYRILLYRFLTDHIPAVHACLWTWVRLAAAPGRYRIDGSSNSGSTSAAEERLADLFRNGYANNLGNRIGFSSMLVDLFASLFRDGRFGGFVIAKRDSSGVDRFIPVEPADIETDEETDRLKLVLDYGSGRIDLQRPDFYYLAHNDSVSTPMGRSMLQPIPFVAYIEQQLVDDMRRSSHNSGFHRLHVKVTPPERLSGESDSAFTERINGYFDATVKMIGSCEVDDNPVTWDNVQIDYIGPEKSREVSNSWFMNHRAMIEEICAGTNLSPYLLGYSYGATTSWANFKFDVVMRQVRSIQTEVSRFMEWLGDIDLAMAGIDARCRFEFDNTFAYQAADRLAQQTGRIDNLLKLLDAGLVDEATAREQAWQLL
jgi:hypothetical protein